MVDKLAIPKAENKESGRRQVVEWCPMRVEGCVCRSSAEDVNNKAEKLKLRITTREGITFTFWRRETIIVIKLELHYFHFPSRKQLILLSMSGKNVIVKLRISTY